MSVTSKIRLATSMQAPKASKLREILTLISRPGVLQFALGMPATDLFPARVFANLSSSLLTENPGALQYAVPSATLKTHIVDLMAKRGVTCRAEQVFLTSGAQQAMSLLAHLLLDPQGQVMLEKTAYEGIVTALDTFRPEILTIPTSPLHGIDVDAVEEALRGGARPAFLYVISEGHNPLGVSLDRQRRRRLVELARRFHVPIMEDDAYGFLTYERHVLPAIRAQDDEWVLYLGSLSKLLAPGLRVGWMVVPEELVPRLMTLKHGADIDVATTSQQLVASFFDSGGLEAHLAKLRRSYRQRRDAMLSALEDHLPEELFWTRPTSGLYIWMELPREVNTVTLLQRAVENEGVAFSPGNAFASDGGPHADHCLRLCFGCRTVEEIEDGIPRLARVISEAVEPFLETSYRPAAALRSGRRRFG